MRYKFGFVLCVAWILGSNVLAAQTVDSMLLSLDDLFRMAETNNKKMIATRYAVEAANKDVEAAKASRLPDVEAQITVNYLGGGYLWDRDFSDGTSVALPHFGNNFSLTVTQVLYAGGAIDRSIDMADLGRVMASLDYERNRQEVRLMLAGSFLDLCKLKNRIRVFEQNISLTERLIENISQKHEQGVALKNDMTRYELQLESLKLQIENACNDYEINNSRLVTMAGLEKGTSIIPSLAHEEYVAMELSLDDWQQRASTGSVLLRQARTSSDMENVRVRLERAAMLPRVALVVRDELLGPVTYEVPALDKNFNYLFAGISVEYSFSSLFKSRNKMARAKLNARNGAMLHEWAIDNVENEVETAYIRLNEARNSLRMESKKMELAEQNYEVINDRYNNGLALLTDMLDATNTKLSAELDVVNAQMNLAFMFLKMKYSCGEL